MWKFRGQTEDTKVGSCHLNTGELLQKAQECSRQFMLKSHTCINPEALKSSCGDLVPELFGERSDNIRLYT